MVELVKQSMADIWASAGDIVMPDSIKINSGWDIEVVPRQYWNWMQNRTDVNLAYIFQHGLPIWDEEVEYIINKSYVQYNGVVYKAILTGVNKNPATEPTYWSIAFASSTAALEAIKTTTPAANMLPYFSGTSTATTTTLSSFARTILDDADASAVRATISAQQADATLTALAGVTATVNKLPYFTGTDVASVTDLTAFARSILDDNDAPAARVTLGLGSASTFDSSAFATPASVALKADSTYVTAQLALKADTATVNAQVALKADLTYVDAQNALKASTSYVDAQDALKANLTYVNAQDALKANLATTVSRDSATGAGYMPVGSTAQRPSGSDGMLRYNSDLLGFEGYANGNWGTVGGGAKGSGTNKVFYENDQTVTADYTITTGQNAMTSGPITVSTGITVTVPTGSTWSVV